VFTLHHCRLLLPCVVLLANRASALQTEVRIDTGQADAVLAILGGADQWSRLWNTEGYGRLKKRDTEMGRAFADSEFREFVESAGLKARRNTLSTTLHGWKQADMESIGRRVGSYLPPGAELKATVYIVIKPRSNSFVYELSTNPAIFLYLDPGKTKAQFENIVAHELHHVGLASVSRQTEGKLLRLSANVRAAVQWLGAFGEGLAMLAAAGSPDIHPHKDSVAQERMRWDRDLKNMKQDMRAIEEFLLAIFEGRLDEQQQRKKAMSFFGTQGPWYTVGWQMAVAVEKSKGRAELLDCMLDMRKLLFSFNDAAKAMGLPLWSEDLLTALGTL
jgi:Putative zinc dependent peptidase (DUF5700)